jgi:hypothetical protein
MKIYFVDEQSGLLLKKNPTYHRSGLLPKEIAIDHQRGYYREKYATKH